MQTRGEQGCRNILNYENKLHSVYVCVEKYLLNLDTSCHHYHKLHDYIILGSVKEPAPCVLNFSDASPSYGCVWSKDSHSSALHSPGHTTIVGERFDSSSINCQ